MVPNALMKTINQHGLRVAVSDAQRIVPSYSFRFNLLELLCSFDRAIPLSIFETSNENDFVKVCSFVFFIST